LLNAANAVKPLGRKGYSTILAFAFNNRPLTRERGAPVRLYSPIKLGYKMTKYVSAMSFTRERHGGYWEDQGYPWLAGV